MQKFWKPKNDVVTTTMARVLKITIAMTLVMLLLSEAAQAVAIKPLPGPIFDTPYYKLAEQGLNPRKWEKEDKDVQDKLDALKAKFDGKRPNIIYILTDDVGFGELGWQGGGKHRGTPSAELDKMAYEGMRFWHSYSEPSCTPSRVAIMTGRHPVRTGLLSVLWPGQTDGLSPEEKTLAEVLSDAGYDTAMWGKWHLGEMPWQAPENQGFDRSYYGLYNGAADFWPASSDFYENLETPKPSAPPFYDFPGEEKYAGLTGIDLNLAGYQFNKAAGDRERHPIEGVAGILGPERQEAFEEESIAQITQYIKDRENSDKPFFIYWASYAQQIAGSSEHKEDEYVDHANAQASFMAMHNEHVAQLLNTLKETGMAENTLVVWWSDNGPMYSFWPTSGYTWLTGGKGDVLEGGVRVPAMAWWPGMIEPGQEPIDTIHLTDLYTTAARIGEALDYIPNDRVTDGIDQTAMLLLGEGHSHRNYIFHYNSSQVGALRYEDFKFFPTGNDSGGLPEMKVYNVMRDPGEKYGELYPYLWTVTPIQNILDAHLKLIEKYPHREPEKTIPVQAATQLISPHD